MSVMGCFSSAAETARSCDSFGLKMMMTETETKTRRETRRSIVERMGQPSSKKNVRGGRVRDSRLDVEKKKNRSSPLRAQRNHMSFA
jgi:hypothetical protein